MNKRLILAALTLTGVAFLVGCGGGGGSGTPPFTSPTATFPLQAAYRALSAAGTSYTFSISGTCSGTAQLTGSAPVSSSFEGRAALVTTQTFNGNLTGCTPASFIDTSTVYLDASNYLPLGETAASGEYSQTNSSLPDVPTSVKVGDTMTVLVQTIYSNSSQTTVEGSRTLSFVVEADTAVDTAVVNFTSRTVDKSNQLLATQQNRYRISASGTLTLLSIDTQAGSTSATHLLFTRI